MRNSFRLVLVALLGATLACQTILGPSATRVPPVVTRVVTRVATAAPGTPRPPEPTPLGLPTLSGGPTQPPAQATPAGDTGGVRECAYKPGNPVAQMPPEVAFTPTPFARPTFAPPTPAAVDSATTAAQLRNYQKIWQLVNDTYIYPDFNGHDWQAIGDRYRALIKQGVSDEGYFRLMDEMLAELQDDHSRFLDPATVQEQANQHFDFVGVGALVITLPNAGPMGDAGMITTVFPGSPAEKAGLRPHDLILKVDGGPLRDEQTGRMRTLGTEGTPVTVTYQRPGEAPQDVTIIRGRVNSNTPIDYCLVSGTRIGYIYVPTFEDESITDQIRAALQAMTAAGPLDGLVLDNRLNGGGYSTVATPFMELFASGYQGDFINRQEKTPLNLKPENIGNSQSVPLVVLIGPETGSYGEITSGVLQVAGRATLVGQNTAGVVERLYVHDLSDGSQAWIASETFQPRGQSNAAWRKIGVTPDVVVPTRWDLFSEASDPALAKAVEILQRKK